MTFTPLDKICVIKYFKQTILVSRLQHGKKIHKSLQQNKLSPFNSLQYIVLNLVTYFDIQDFRNEVFGKVAQDIISVVSNCLPIMSGQRMKSWFLVMFLNIVSVDRHNFFTFILFSSQIKFI